MSWTYDTIHWLPPHLAKMTEWQEICKAYDYLLSQAIAALDEVYANQYLDSLTEIGCQFWERILMITVTEGETLEERRQAIQSYFVSDLPYTEKKLREVLEAMAGADNVTLTVTPADYELRVDLTISTPSIIHSVEDIVYKMRPCNLTVRICINYKYKDPGFVGLAIKQVKTLYPSTISTSDPVADLDWYYIDDSSTILVDSDNDVLVEEA